MTNVAEKHLKVSGFDIEFPFEPYPSQLSMMEKVLQAIDQSQNALLEAPTGSGKSLALLCSSLAWQQSQKQKLAKEAGLAHPLPIQIDEDEQDIQIQINPIFTNDTRVTSVQQLQKMLKKTKPPVIFYTTRTHSQIGHIVKELKASNYRPTMTVLASRDHYCINPFVMNKKGKDEECKRLIDNKSCRFHQNVPTFRRNKIVGPSSALEVWDIEDLIYVSQQHTSCPYFFARGLISHAAEIIFCPYNYLIDPIIRDAMDINLKGAIIIIDEAHNIEDVCRDASSLEIDIPWVEESFYQLQRLSASDQKAELYQPLYRIVSLLFEWMNSMESKLADSDYNEKSKIFEGPDMAEILIKQFEIIPKNLENLWNHFRQAVQASSDAKKHELHLGTRPIILLEKLFTLFQFILRNDFNDFKMALISTKITENNTNNRNFQRSNNNNRKWMLKLNIWCLNPWVAFQALTTSARSILLTSGTLSPMDSFATELNTNFSIRLEAPHIINTDSQLWIGYISSSPAGIRLNASHKYTDTTDFQDQIGSTIVNLCKIIPYGVLCFFPSYRLIEKLQQRWQQTRLWDQLCAVKQVFIEPRNSDEEFDNIMKQYYQAVRDCPPIADSGVSSGALFIAVFRGKVSEGVDFTDNNARAVLAVGIPYPYIKDKGIQFKKEYNNRKSSVVRGVLTGERWYNLQAYRALNQAVGRCIRHRYDYGAIILIDDRFQNGLVTGQLSQWVRPYIKHFYKFNDCMVSIRDFFQKIQANPPSDINKPVVANWINNYHAPTVDMQNMCINGSINTSKITQNSKTTIKALPFFVPINLRTDINKSNSIDNNGVNNNLTTTTTSTLNDNYVQQVASLFTNNDERHSQDDDIFQDTPPELVNRRHDSIGSNEESRMNFIHYIPLDDEPNFMPEDSPTSDVFQDEDVIVNLAPFARQAPKPIHIPLPPKIMTINGGDSDIEIIDEAKTENMGSAPSSPFSSTSVPNRQQLKETIIIDSPFNAHHNSTALYLCNYCNSALNNVHNIVVNRTTIISKTFFCDILSQISSVPNMQNVEVFVLLNNTHINSEICKPLDVDSAPPEISKLNVFLENKESLNGLWSKEDGLVYLSLFCNGCKPIRWIGMEIKAANSANQHLLDQIWLPTALVKYQENPLSINNATITIESTDNTDQIQDIIIVNNDENEQKKSPINNNTYPNNNRDDFQLTEPITINPSVIKSITSPVKSDLPKKKQNLKKDFSNEITTTAPSLLLESGIDKTAFSVAATSTTIIEFEKGGNISVKSPYFVNSNNNQCEVPHLLKRFKKNTPQDPQTAIIQSLPTIPNQPLTPTPANTTTSTKITHTPNPTNIEAPANNSILENFVTSPTKANKSKKHEKPKEKSKRKKENKKRKWSSNLDGDSYDDSDDFENPPFK